MPLPVPLLPAPYHRVPTSTRRRGPAVPLSLSSAPNSFQLLLQLLLDAPPPDESTKLAKTIAAKGSKEPSGAVPFALKGMEGSVRCIAEYRKKGNLGVVWEVDPPVMMSVLFRQSGAHAVAALLDAATGGCDIGDVEEIVREQENARGNFPGPLPMIVHDLVVDEVQLAQAASVGAEGIVLTANVLGEKLEEMTAAAKVRVGLWCLWSVVCCVWSCMRSQRRRVSGSPHRHPTPAIRPPPAAHRPPPTTRHKPPATYNSINFLPMAGLRPGAGRRVPEQGGAGGGGRGGRGGGGAQRYPGG